MLPQADGPQYRRVRNGRAETLPLQYQYTGNGYTLAQRWQRLAGPGCKSKVRRPGSGAYRYTESAAAPPTAPLVKRRHHRRYPGRLAAKICPAVEAGSGTERPAAPVQAALH